MLSSGAPEYRITRKLLMHHFVYEIIDASGAKYIKLQRILNLTGISLLPCTLNKRNVRGKLLSSFRAYKL